MCQRFRISSLIVLVFFTPLFVCNPPDNPTVLREPLNRNLLHPSPFAILHVGLPKAASTTIQHALSMTRKWLSEDNYLVYPMHDTLKFFVFMNPIDRNSSIFRHFQEFLRQAQASRSNIILSYEGLSGYHAHSLLRELLEPWNIRIVVCYRRLYEWCSSLYFERNRFKAENAPSICNWPSQTEPGPLQALLSHYQTHCRVNPVPDIINNLKAYYDHISVLNIHQRENLLHDFFCDTLPHAKITCEQFGSHKMLERMNPSYSLKMNDLAVAAHRAGLIDAHVTREEAFAWALVRQMQLNISDMDLPLRCFDREEQKKLLSASLAAEQELFPEWYSSALGQLDHEIKFWKHASSQLCMLDAEKVLEDEDWREYLRMIGSKNSSDLANAMMPNWKSFLRESAGMRKLCNSREKFAPDAWLRSG